MSGRIYDAALPLADRRIKRAFKQLVAAVGGTTEASAIAGKRQQRISDAQLPNCPEFPDLKAVLTLEEEARGTEGWPQATRAMARHHGFELIDCGTLPDKADWHKALATAQLEFGEAASKLVAALGSGTVTAGEIRSGNLIVEIDQVLCPLMTLRGLAVAAQAEEDR